MACGQFNNLPDLSDKQKRRFWKKVKIGAPEECWPWIGGTVSGGYGSVGFNGTNFLTHRIAYFLTTGDDPGELLVLHSCDNRPCCNTAHLFKGTVTDNNRDTGRKGRHPLTQMIQGNERPWTAKLTDDQATEIIRLSNGGMMKTRIARLFGIHRQTVYDVLGHKRKYLRHVCAPSQQAPAC